MDNWRCIFVVGKCAPDRPDAGGVGKGRRVVGCVMSGLVYTSVRLRVMADRSIQTPASGSAPSTTQLPTQPEEHRQVRVVVQHAVNQLTACADDLARNLDEG